MAKFCGNCGSKAEDTDRVCGNCGTFFEDAVADTAPVMDTAPIAPATETYSVSPTPAKENFFKKNKKLIIILGAVLVVAIVAVILLVVLLGGGKSAASTAEGFAKAFVNEDYDKAASYYMVDPTYDYDEDEKEDEIEQQVDDIEDYAEYMFDYFDDETDSKEATYEVTVYTYSDEYIELSKNRGKVEAMGDEDMLEMADKIGGYADAAIVITSAEDEDVSCVIYLSLVKYDGEWGYTSCYGRTDEFDSEDWLDDMKDQEEERIEYLEDYADIDDALDAADNMMGDYDDYDDYDDLMNEIESYY